MHHIVPAGIETGVELLPVKIVWHEYQIQTQRYARGHLGRLRLMRRDERLLLCISVEQPDRDSVAHLHERPSW
jgi:hypothetical protein